MPFHLSEWFPEFSGHCMKMGQWFWWFSSCGWLRCGAWHTISQSSFATTLSSVSISLAKSCTLSGSGIGLDSGGAFHAVFTYWHLLSEVAQCFPFNLKCLTQRHIIGCASTTSCHCVSTGKWIHFNHLWVSFWTIFYQNLNGRLAEGTPLWTLSTLPFKEQTECRQTANMKER